MPMPKIISSDKRGITLSDIGNFSPEKTFDCGQCFRFDPTDGGVSGIAHGRRVNIKRIGDTLRIDGITEDDYRTVWEHYLALDEDYDEIDRIIADALPHDRGKRPRGSGKGVCGNKNSPSGEMGDALFFYNLSEQQYSENQKDHFSHE